MGEVRGGFGHGVGPERRATGAVLGALLALALVLVASGSAAAEAGDPKGTYTGMVTLTAFEALPEALTAEGSLTAENIGDRFGPLPFQIACRGGSCIVSGPYIPSGSLTLTGGGGSWSRTLDRTIPSTCPPAPPITVTLVGNADQVEITIDRPRVPACEDGGSGAQGEAWSFVGRPAGTTATATTGQPTTVTTDPSGANGGQTAAAQTGGSGNNDGGTAGLAIGGVVLVAAAAGGFAVWRARRRPLPSGRGGAAAGQSSVRAVHDKGRQVLTLDGPATVRPGTRSTDPSTDHDRAGDTGAEDDG